MKSQWKVFAVTALLLLPACDIPTDVPMLEQRWVVPLEGTTLGVNQLLPAGVSVAGSNFSVAVDPVSTSQTLVGLCSSCIDSGGLSVPVPAFSGSFSSSTNLPSNVTSAIVADGAVQITIQNGFSFDPVAGGGSLTITLRDGPNGRELGRVVMNATLPPGSTTSRTLSISAGSVGTSLSATAAVVSAGGQVAPTSTSDQISVTATTTSLLVSSATVNVAGTSVQIDPVDLDVEGVDASVTDHIDSGALILDIVNPFGVSVTGNIVIGSVSKSFTLSPSATSTITLSYSGEELSSFLGQPNVTFTGSGTVSGGSVSVTPGQEMTLKATLDMTIQIG